MGNLTRRGFIKGAAAGAVGVAAGAGILGGLAGCAPESSGPAGGGTSGTGTATARGNGGDVEVTVTVKDGTITKVEALGPKETQGIGSRATEWLPGRMVEANSVEVDGVTGATISSNAVLIAAKEAYGQAIGQPAEHAAPQDGRFVSSCMGMMGNVYVATTFEGGAIKEVRFLSSNETEHLSFAAIERIPSKIQENNSLAVDAVTGATSTSNAIIECVRKSIMKAGGSPLDFMREVPADPVIEATEEREVDVVIVGAGIAGLNAAWNLTKAGKKVLNFDKSSYYGGCFLVSGGLIMSTETMLHKAYGLERLEGFMSSKQAFMDTYRSVLDKESPYYNPDMPYIDVMITKGSEMVDQLVMEGVGFAPLNKYGDNPYIGSGPWSNYRQNAGSVNAVDMMYDRITYAGNEIVTETKVTELVMDGDAVAGVKAVSDDGTQWTVRAKAVLLCTGGWMQNKELVEQYAPDYAGFYVNAPFHNTGDGLFLAQSAGGAWTMMDRGITSTNKAFTSKSNTIFFYTDIPILLVDANGQRFVNERSSYKKYLRLCTQPEHGGRFYYIFDKVGFALAHDSDNYDISYQYLIDKGDIVEYGSVEAMAEDLDLPHLAETIDSVNAIARGEAEDEFGNEELPSIETRGKLYAMRIEPGAYITHGGIKIDPETRVQREDDSVVKGLYAAGMTTGSMEVRDGGDYGNGNCQALAFSLKAAETIVSDLG